MSLFVILKSTKVMIISIYQVDAFASHVFSGNPAAVCILDEWLDDDVLQNIAAENNLAETAYIIEKEHGYDLRWFTPEVEIDLCGHATLASAYIVFEFLKPDISVVSFNTMSGELIVSRNDTGMLSMDFPSRAPVQAAANDLFEEALGCAPIEVWKSRDYLLLLNSESEVKSLNPNMEKLKEIDDCFAVIVTARGDSVDFVSRFFAPNAGIPEDPVTGSAHCTLIPFWAGRLSTNTLHAKQISQRTGELFCENKGDRVTISGYATLFLKGEIYL